MSLHVQDLVLGRAKGESLLGPVSFALDFGQRIGLAGPSGIGKSLLVQALFGVLPPGIRQLSGSIRAWGTPMEVPSSARDRVRSRMGWIPQHPLQALNPHLRVQEHLTLLPSVHRGESRAGALHRLIPLLEQMRLPSGPAFLRRFPHELSGGQRQRLCLAMALSCDPDLLVLDEPTTALDPLVQADFLALMREVRQARPLGWLWISHDRGVLRAMCSDLLALEAAA